MPLLVVDLWQVANNVFNFILFMFIIELGIPLKPQDWMWELTIYVAINRDGPRKGPKGARAPPKPKIFFLLVCKIFKKRGLGPLVFSSGLP